MTERWPSLVISVSRFARHLENTFFAWGFRLVPQELTLTCAVDDEFPPLGAAPKDRNDLPYRPYLPQGPQEQSVRSGTPTLPPGLPLPHGHPAAALLQHDISNPQSPASSVSYPVPPPPGLPASRRGTPIQKPQESISRKQTPVMKETQGDTSAERPTNPAEISLGSPKMKPANRKNREEKAADPSPAPEKESPAPATETPKRAERTKKAKPIKLNLAMPTPQLSEVATTKETSSQNAPAVAPAPAPAPQSSQIGSRPNTPLTGVSRTSDSSGPRPPRVLRVVDTPKNETPPPSEAQSTSSAAASKDASKDSKDASKDASKARSRRPSLSSLSRPATPGDVGSDYDPNTSASVSRANSPPPSRVGSAPVRTMTKSQAKKERRLKAKQAEEAKKEEALASTPVEEPVQAPIIGRKRKTKKTPASSSEQSTTAATNSTDAGKSSEGATADKEEQKSDANRKGAKSKDKANKDEKSEEKKPEAKDPAEAWKTNNTIEQLLKDAESSGRSIKELFLERTSPLHAVLGHMHKAGEIDLNTHPLFNPPNLNQRTDMKCTVDDYDNLKRPIELTEEHRKMLLRGEPVRINQDSDLLKNRCLITPRGCVLRNLSAEEEDRYLELEKRVSPEAMQEFPAISMNEPDPTNMNGGLDALFATPEKFNIRWVDDTSQTNLTLDTAGAVMTEADTSAATTASAPPNVLSTMEADTTRSHSWAIANTAELVNATAASVRSFAAATAKHMLGVAGVALGEIPDIEDVRAMSDEELRSYIERSQRELETSRKEFESLDKKFNALVKRNKKLAQQALSVAVEAAK